MDLQSPKAEISDDLKMDVASLYVKELVAYLMQMVPADGELHSHMHVTPLRSSRALALRFLANKFGLDMSKLTASLLFSQH